MSLPGGASDAVASRDRSPSAQVSRRVSAPAVGYSSSISSPSRRQRGIGGEDSVQFALRSETAPRSRSPSLAAALTSDPWGADPNPIPESRRRSPTRRVVSPMKSASMGAPCTPQSCTRSPTPQGCLRSPTLQTHEIEAFWIGKRSPVAGAATPQGHSDSPSRQHHARSPSPSAQGLVSPTRPIFPGYSHCSNHAERPVLNERPGHRVAKMWTSDTVDGAIRMAPGQARPEPLLAASRIPVMEGSPKYSNSSPDASVAGDEPVILLTPRCRPAVRSLLPSEDKDLKGAVGGKSPQAERHLGRADGMPGRLQLPSGDDEGPRGTTAAKSPLVERPTLPITRAGSAAAAVDCPAAGSKSLHMGKPGQTVRADLKSRSNLSQVRGDVGCRSPQAASQSLGNRMRSPLKGSQPGWK